MFLNLARVRELSFMCIKLVSFALLLTCTFSCKNVVKKSKYTNDEAIFNEYLSSIFHLKINSDSTNYILISDDGCHGCIERAIITLSNYPKSTFILSKAGIQKYGAIKENTSPAHILIDSSLKINRLKYHNSNIGIIQTAKGEIYNIVNMDAVNLYDIIKSMSK